MDKTLYKVRTFNFEIEQASIAVNFKDLMIIISPKLKATLNNISDVIYHFVGRFPIGHVYNKVKDKQMSSGYKLRTVMSYSFKSHVWQIPLYC